MHPRGEGQVKHAVFGLGFVPLFVGVRVGHDATTSAPSQSVAACFGFEEGRPDRHGKFKVLASEPTDRAAVRTSWACLKLVNVMHCHNFWSARDGAAGEGRGHDVFETNTGTKGGFHFGDGLENCGMPLDRARFSHPNGSWNRHPSQVIAEEIHDHVKFSGILHAVEQFIGITITRTRPLDGTCEQLIAPANEK